MENEKVEKNYKLVCSKLAGPDFRIPIKDFIDQYCTYFLDIDENTLEMKKYYEEFKKLIENNLTKINKELNITENDFLLITEKGRNDPKYKRYFEQIVNLNDFNYFKKIMINRHYQIVKVIEKEAKKRSDQSKQLVMNDSEKIYSEEEDRNRRLEAIERQELKRAKKNEIKLKKTIIIFIF